MKVLLGHAYFLRFDPKLHEAMRPYPPLGTMLAAAQLRAAGHDVVVYDAMLEEDTSGWAHLLSEHRPDAAVIFEDNFNYLSKMCLLNMRDAAIEMLGAAGDVSHRAICGSDATDNIGLYLDAGADVVMRGEGDLTLLELCERWETGVELDGLAGASWREDGRQIDGPDRRNMKELDTVPFPARDLVDMDRYADVWREHHGRFSTNLVSTRGCPYHCNWCAKPIWGQRYNARSAEDVVAEMTELVREHGADHLWFADDIVGLKPGWVPHFADLLEAAELDTPFTALSRPDLLVRHETAEAFGRAGCEIVWIGAESGSQSVLDAMEKGTTVEQIVEAADRVHAAGFKIAFFIQFGYPGETWDDIQATLRLIRRARPDDVGVSVSYPLPGTPFHERVEQQLGDKRNWTDSDDLAMLFEGPYTSAFYRELHRRLHLEYRARRVVWRVRGGDRPGLREIASALFGLAKLPVSMTRLRRLERSERRSVDTLPIELSPDAAATPTPQPVELRTTRTSTPAQD